MGDLRTPRLNMGDQKLKCEILGDLDQMWETKSLLNPL